MSTQSNAQAEPSMEEILASIRRIISEDGEEETPAPQQALRPRPTAVPPAPAPQPQRTAPVRETPATTPTVEEDRAETHLKTEDVEMIKKTTATAAREEAMIDETTASVASKAFQSLTQTVRVSKGEGRTLEDIVTEMLKPMVKEWLDANLAGIVEEKVEDEVQRLARRRG
jgi:hypothetical protein